MQQVEVKKNLSVRLAPKLRQELEFIAKREMRTLANQITVFLTQGVVSYFDDERNNKAYNDYLMSVSSDEQ